MAWDEFVKWVISFRGDLVFRNACFLYLGEYFGFAEGYKPLGAEIPYFCHPKSRIAFAGPVVQWIE